MTIAVLLIAGTACGLTQTAARDASDEVTARALAAREKGCPHGECVASAMVRGALAQLHTPAQRAQLSAMIRSVVEDVIAEASSPEQLAQIRLITETAARSAVQGFLGTNGQMPTVGSLTDQTLGAVRNSLGATGEGPLATSLAATAERVSASTVRGIRGEAGLFPECTGPDRARCVDERLTALSRAASIGVRDGLRGLVALPLLALSFVLGLIVAVLMSWLWTHRGTPTTHGEHRSARPRAHASAH